MIDPEVAWVPFEFFEWGNPIENKTIFESMLSYSPYENIDRVRILSSSSSDPLLCNYPPCPAFSTRRLEDGEKRDVPSVMITGGLYDSRVQVWEPVQYTARLRYAANQDGRSGRVILRIYDQGHYSGGSYTELVEWMSFFLVELGVMK